MILKDTETGTKTPLDAVGPIQPDKCPGHAIPSTLISMGAIFADENQVYGLRIVSSRGAADMGNLDKGTPILENFNVSK